MPRPHTITVNGNTQISTAQSKFGGSSIEFDGAGDNLSIASTSDFGFGTGDFTIEAWVNGTAAGVRTIFDFRNNTATDNGGWLRTIGNYELRWTVNGSTVFSFTSLNSAPYNFSTDTWHHIAVSRENSTTRFFFNGSQIGSGVSDSTNYGTSKPLTIGAGYTNTQNFDGFIDELRITKGVARYTTTFTPSTTAFANDSDTVLLIHADGTNGSTTITDDNSVLDPYLEAQYFEQDYFEGDAALTDYFYDGYIDEKYYEGDAGTIQEASASFTDTFAITANNTKLLTAQATSSAQFTVSSTVGKIVQDSATMSDSITLSNTITRLRTVDVTMNDTFTQSAEGSLTKGYNATITSEVSTQSSVGAIRQGSVTMSGAFTPVMSAVAIKNSTALMDVNVSLQFTISKFTGNEGTLENIVNLSLQSNALFSTGSLFGSSINDPTVTSAQFTLSITADKIKEAEIQINSPYYEDGYLVDDYYENAGFDLTCDFDKVKEAQIEMDSPYYEDGYIDEDYFISKGFTLSIVISKVLFGNADISSSVTQSTDAQRLRTVDANPASQFTQSTQINRTRSFASTFTVEFTQSASVNEIQDFTSTPSSEFGISVTTDRIRSHSATIQSQVTLACEFSEIDSFEISTQSQFTQTTIIEVIRGYQANLVDQVNQTADVSRSRDFDITMTSAFTQNAVVERFGGVSVDLQSQASLNIEIGTLETAQITMSGVFTPVLAVNALRNMTAIMDVVATVQTDANVITENQSNLQTEFTQTTQGDRIRFLNASFTASISLAQQQIETITPFEAQLSVQAQLQQQLIEKTVQGAANINSEAQITYNTIELITPFEADIQAQFTQSTQGDRIRFIDDTLSAQFTFTPVIGNLQQFEADLTDAFTPVMSINVVRDVLSSMANQFTASITAEKITDINSTLNSEFTQSTSETLFKSFGSNPVAVFTQTTDVGIVFQSDFLSQSVSFIDQSAVVSNEASGFNAEFTMPAVKVNAARPSIEFEAVGDAELDTAYQQFGTASLYLDGSGDQVRSIDSNNTAPYITAPANWDDTTDYTVEFWFKPDWTYFNAVTQDLGQTYPMVQIQNFKISLAQPGTNNQMSLRVYNNTTSELGSTTITASGGWYHVALTGHNTGLGGNSNFRHRLRLNGVKLGGSGFSDGAWYESTSQIAPTASGVRIMIGSTLGTQYAGWIDELRISHSARYPDVYPHSTVPMATTAFGNDEETLTLLHFDGADNSTDMVDDGGFTTTFESSQSAQFSLTAQGDKFRIFSATFNVIASQLTAAVKTADFVTVPDTQFTMSVDADYTVDNTAQFTSQATQTATATRIKTLESTQTSETNVTAQAVKTVSAQFTEIVEFTQTAQAVKTVSAQAQIQDAMSFGIQAFLVRDTEQNLIVQATMAVTGARIRFADSTQSASTTLSADVNSIGFAEADMSVTATLTSEYTKIPEIQITAISVASVDLTAGIERIRPFEAQITDAMSFITQATANLVGVISMDTQASMSVSADRIRNTGGTFVNETTQTTIAVKKLEINSTFNINTSLSVIAFELQVFDLIYTIPNESRINTVESEQRLYTIRDENRLYTIEGE
jgi:hypothetical protein